MPLYTPHALQALVEARVGVIGETDFIVKQEHQRLREMWCAARFAVGYSRNFSFCQVDVKDRDEGRDFDFHLRIAEASLPFQVVEALDEGRRRDFEYRHLSHTERHELQHARMKGRATYASERLREALSRKAMKRYSRVEALHVLVYLNAAAAAVPWASIAGATEAEAKAFASVWVVTQDLLCCIYGGKRWSGLVGWKRIDAER